MRQTRLKRHIETSEIQYMRHMTYMRDETHGTGDTGGARGIRYWYTWNPWGTYDMRLMRHMRHMRPYETHDTSTFSVIDSHVFPCYYITVAEWVLQPQLPNTVLCILCGIPTCPTHSRSQKLTRPKHDLGTKGPFKWMEGIHHSSWYAHFQQKLNQRLNGMILGR